MGFPRVTLNLGSERRVRAQWHPPLTGCHRAGMIWFGVDPLTTEIRILFQSWPSTDRFKESGS